MTKEKIFEMMKKAKYCISALFVLIVLLLTGCSGKTTNTYSLQDVAVGDTFEITLAAHGGTAYRWDYTTSPKSGIEYVTREFIPRDNDPEMIGGGTFVYMFQATKAGSYKIKFKLQIIGKTEPPIEISTYKITVIES